MPSHRASPLLCAMLLVTACGTTTQFAATNPSPRPLTARPAGSVEVFATGLPDRPFVEIGLIQARQSSEFSGDDMQEILDEMRTEAARRGCDGLVINGTRDAQSPNVVAPGSKTLDGFWGACIVFTNDPPSTVATSGSSNAP